MSPNLQLKSNLAYADVSDLKTELPRMTYVRFAYVYAFCFVTHMLRWPDIGAECIHVKSNHSYPTLTIINNDE